MHTPRVQEILSWYGSDNPGTLANLARLLNHGRLGGTGKLVILPVDQGFEHGPARSFAVNPPAYDPRYHFELAIESGCNAYAAPLGFHRGGRARIRRRNSAHPQDQQSRRSSRREGSPARVDQRRGGCPAARLRRHRLHDLSRLGSSRRDVRAVARDRRRCEGSRPGRGRSGPIRAAPA